MESLIEVDIETIKKSVNKKLKILLTGLRKRKLK